MVEVTVVKRPVEAVVAPIEVLLMVDAVVGLIVNAPAGLIATVPVPVGLNVIAALDPLKPTVELADSVVNAPVVGVVAPTVPLMLIDAVPVKLVTVPDVGVPNAGVTNVGEVANTNAPVPVSSVTADIKLAEFGVAKNVATPEPNPLMPVPTGNPVALVNVPELGVPNAPPLVNGVAPFDAAVILPCASTVIEA
jgi:hypothetical protein